MTKFGNVFFFLLYLSNTSHARENPPNIDYYVIESFDEVKETDGKALKVFDVDGTLLSQDTVHKYLQPAASIPGAVEYVNFSRERGDSILGLTARTPLFRLWTFGHLFLLGFRFDNLARGIDLALSQPQTGYLWGVMFSRHDLSSGFRQSTKYKSLLEFIEQTGLTNQYDAIYMFDNEAHNLESFQANWPETMPPLKLYECQFE